MISNGTWSNVGVSNKTFTTKENLYVDKEVAQLLHTDAIAGDEAGIGVSISSDGSRIAIGANYADRLGLTNTGAAYIFELENGSWVQKAALLPSSVQANDYFGCSVSLSGDGNRVAVGAYMATRSSKAECGYTTIFKRVSGVWTEEATLTPTVATTLDWFGFYIFKT